MKRSLEERVTEGRVTWIQRVEYEPMEHRAAFFFSDNLEESGRTRVLTFSDITGFSDISHDSSPDFEVHKQLIGLDEHPEVNSRRKEAGIIQYVIHTDEREFLIDTRTQPQLK